ncbi:hypothetical protein, partial [Bradyrhizobium sp. TM233]|uniref:hypothetical protein n=1 Tax=Bradyrhizobium sp. TM233 TaxID=2599801 RepID=UPI0030C6ACF3
MDLQPDLRFGSMVEQLQYLWEIRFNPEPGIPNPYASPSFSPPHFTHQIHHLAASYHPESWEFEFATLG